MGTSPLLQAPLKLDCCRVFLFYLVLKELHMH